LQQLGARCVVFNFRGRGGHSLTTPRTYSSCNSEDLGEVIHHINSRFPRAPLMAVGVSMGGILLGNYLTHVGEAAVGRVRAAMLLSICFDTFKGMESLEQPGFNRMLNTHLASCLGDSVRQMSHHFEHEDSFANLNKVFSARTIREFDAHFTAPQFGYRDSDDYYADARLAGKLAAICVPVLAINAEDDPCQPGESLPLAEVEATDHVAVLKTRYGGHIGFMEGLLPTRYCLSDRIFGQFSKAVFGQRGQRLNKELRESATDAGRRFQEGASADEGYINF